MARQLRLEFPGAFYHVTSRGNEQKAVLKTNTIGKNILNILRQQLNDIVILNKVVERIEERLTLSKVETLLFSL